MSDWLAAPPESGVAAGFRLLCVGTTEPDWIGLTLQLDAIGCHDPRFRWVSTPSETMTLLRQENFDCIIIECVQSIDGGKDRDDDNAWDAIALLQAIRASGCDDPLILLSRRPDDGLVVDACRFQCELLVSSALWSSRALVNVMQRTIGQALTARENHQHAVANHRRLVRERDEAGHLLRQQRDIISELEVLAHGVSADSDCNRRQSVVCGAESSDEDSEAIPEQRTHSIAVPDEVRTYYYELLRTYVIMGSGNLGAEIGQLARILAEFKLSPRDTLSLHLERVEHVVKGLGNRSTRHVMARADLLALELIIHLGECYQQAASAEPVGS
jgi:DNA-binding NarL/FixJ family response regulator